LRDVSEGQTLTIETTAMSVARSQTCSSEVARTVRAEGQRSSLALTPECGLYRLWDSVPHSHLRSGLI